MPDLTITKSQNCAQRQVRGESRLNQNRSTVLKNKNERDARACASTKSRNVTPTNYRCENPWEIGSVARAGRDADPLTPRKAATVAMLCATAQSWNMYIEKLSEKSLPKENQKARRKDDLNTEMEDMRDEEG